jgi:hypothetical protein
MSGSGVKVGNCKLNYIYRPGGRLQEAGGSKRKGDPSLVFCRLPPAPWRLL